MCAIVCPCPATGLDYITQLVSQLESHGLIPLPIFINGVEAHTVVRDQLTSEDEKRALERGIITTPSLRADAVKVRVAWATP